MRRLLHSLETWLASPPLRQRVLVGIVGVWVLLLLGAFEPGLMSPDSLMQVQQGLEGTYGDWHPPLVSWLCGLAVRLAGSPWPLLLLQLALLGLGLARLLERTAPGWRAGAGAVAVLAATLALPPVWGTAVTLWKDVLLAVCLLWVVVALQRRRPWTAVLLLLISAALRHNAVLAVPALAIPTAGAFPWCRTRLRTLGIAAAITVASAAFPSLVMRVFHASDQFPGGSLLWYDLAGLALDAPEVLAQSSVAGEISFEDLRRTYDPSSVGYLLWGAEGPRRLPWSGLEQRKAGLSRDWRRAVRAHPGLYLRHRLRLFALMLGFTGPSPYPFQTTIEPNPWGFHPPTGALFRWARGLEDAARDGVLFRAWAWLLITCALCAVGWTQRRRRPLILWTALSALAYGLGYLLVSVGIDFRYWYWPVVADAAAVALWLCARATPEAEQGVPVAQPSEPAAA